MNYWKFIKSGLINKVSIGALGLISLSAIGFYLWKGSGSLKTKLYWEDYTDEVLSITTLLVALFLWVYNSWTEWKKGLPQKLDVDYKLTTTEETIFFVRNAPLAGDDDIRNWGQSIAQGVYGGRIPLEGFFIYPPKIVANDSGDSVLKYLLTIWLEDTEKIKELKDKNCWFDDKGKIIHSYDSLA